MDLSLEVPEYWEFHFCLDQYCIMILAFSRARMCRSPPLLSSASIRISHSILIVSWSPFFGSLFLSHTSLFNDGNFLPRSECELMWWGSWPPTVPDEAWWEITQSSLLSDCNSLFGCNKQANPCMRVHAHTHIHRHLWLCALITLCEITTVTAAVWATPRFPGHSGHQLPKTARAPSLSGTAAHNESSSHCARCSDTPETLSSIRLSLPLFSVLLFSTLPQRFQLVGDVVCDHLRCIDGRGRGTGLAGASPLGECMMVEGVGGGLPLSLWCVTSAAALSPTNGALVEPCKESPAEVLFESVWGQWGTAGSVWSTSADVERMSTVGSTTNDHSLSTQSGDL